MSGVAIHGKLHRLRLYDAFYKRQAIHLQTVVIMATALMRHENQEVVMRQVRQLTDMLYPEDPEKKLEQEEALKDVLRREGKKSYKVMTVNLGERSE